MVAMLAMMLLFYGLAHTAVTVNLRLLHESQHRMQVLQARADALPPCAR